MTVLFLLLPVTALGLSFLRVTPGWLYCGNMAVLTGLATVNLAHTVWFGAVKSVTLVTCFLNVGFPVSLGVHLDFYSSYTVWVVFTISFLVHLYSTSYMGHDPRLFLFLSYLTLFTFFMVILLVSPNYLQLFMGWEGVGLTSYLLVNFWHTRTQANKSALKALLVNRVGDFFFLYGLFLLINTNATLSFADLTVDRHPGLAFFVVAAAAAKSAQLGLHTWLPDAMEGPTPVSALIHAATMVTAGIFLLFRTSHLVVQLQPLLVVLGGVTALFAGTVALFQFDLKRVIAYSTCSQLGYMVVAYSLDFPELSLYHLGNHAFFKALLFLLAGLVIHAVADEQDMRRMGGLSRVLPVTYTLFVLASLALVGFPFLSGFYSKDLILEALYGGGHWFGYAACLAAAYLTAYYSVRTLVLVFAGNPRGSRTTYMAAIEADSTSLVVVSVLGFLSLVHGWLLRDVVVGFGTTVGWSTPGLAAEFSTPIWVKLLPLVLSAVAAATAVRLERRWSTWWSTPWVVFFSKRWGWDAVDSAATRRLLVKSYFLYVAVERGVLEQVGPTGVARAVARLYDLVRFRGWFTLLWVVSLAGFTFLGWATTVGVDFFPYLPFAVVVGKPDAKVDQ